MNVTDKKIMDLIDRIKAKYKSGEVTFEETKRQLAVMCNASHMAIGDIEADIPQEW